MRFPRKSLYHVTDRGLSLGRPLSFIIQECLRAGVGVVQYREKDFQYKRDFAEVQHLREICRDKALFLVNDRVDLALAISADGVHLGQSDMPVLTSRELLGQEKIIGLSLETEEDLDEFLASRELQQATDYIALSPIFPTPTKTNTKNAWGVSGIGRVRNLTSHPIVGIGGISISNADEILTAGVDSLAVVSAICSDPDPYTAALKLHEKIQHSQ